MEYDQGTSTPSRIRVLVADNSLIHTQLLADALKRDRNLEVVTADADFQGVIAAALSRNIDVLLVSSNLDEQLHRGFDVLRELRVARPEIRTVILLDSSKPEVILDAFRAGARGIFSRSGSIDALCKCVRSVHHGQIWANSQEMSLALEALASAPTVRAVNANGLTLLSKRELEVVQSLAEGLTNREIAEKLGLSQHTVKNYLFRVFDKLGVSSRIELLFMTLSQNSPTQSLINEVLRDPRNTNQNDEAAFALCKKAAEEGGATAQLALAQMYGARQTPRDLVNAYMWYLIAEKQNARARKSLARLMKPEQVLEAEQKAADWIDRSKKPSGVARTASFEAGAGAAAD